MAYLLSISLNWEFAWDVVKSFLVPLAGSAFGVWATFEIFSRQLAVNHQNQLAELARTFQEENQKQDNQAAARLSNFVWLLEDIMKFASTQNNDYLEVAKKIDDAPLTLHRLTTRASGTISRILTLKQDDIFASFIRKALDTENNRIHVAKAYNKVDYIKISTKSNKLKYNEHIKTSLSIAAEYRQHIENIREVFLEALNAKEQSDNDFTSFAQHTLSFYRLSFEEAAAPLGIDWHQDEFLAPVLTDLGRNFKNDPRTQIIGMQASRASKLVGRIRYSSETTSKDLKEANELLSKALEELKIEIDYVKSVLMTT